MSSCFRLSGIKEEECCCGFRPEGGASAAVFRRLFILFSERLIHPKVKRFKLIVI